MSMCFLSERIGRTHLILAEPARFRCEPGPEGASLSGPGTVPSHSRFCLSRVYLPGSRTYVLDVLQPGPTPQYTPLPCDPVRVQALKSAGRGPCARAPASLKRPVPGCGRRQPSPVRSASAPRFRTGAPAVQSLRRCCCRRRSDRRTPGRAQPAGGSRTIGSSCR